jgi:UPF0755 protein
MEEEQLIETYHPDWIKKYTKEIAVGSAIFLFFFIFYIFSWSAPAKFPLGSIYDLESGQTLSVVSKNFKDNNIIRSGFWFKSFVVLFSLGKSTIIEGDYGMYKKQSVISLAWRVTRGNLDIVPVRITVTEGMNSFEIADLLLSSFPSFKKDLFLDLVKTNKLEGYLFPDTYFFFPNMSEEKIIEVMNNNFKEKIKKVEDKIKAFGKSESEVIKMASILEGEARTKETREIISGILWKRISIGMALQVDTSFKYINGKTSATLTTEDLKADSPYNSYTRLGLPPTPISNPGLGAIEAAIMPQKTPYFYFLTDKEGEMHYAVSFEEHVANKLKYLK